MPEVELGQVVAERRLTLSPDRTVIVRIGLPVTSREPPHESWCPYQVEGLGSGKVRRIFGVDAVQSLWLTLQIIGCELYTSEAYQAGGLHSFESDPDLGFPVPDNMIDLLPPKPPPPPEAPPAP